MARASTVAWISVAMGMALAPAGAVAQAPAAPGAVEAAGQTDVRPSKTHLALKNAIDSYRKGEHEQAETCFKQAQAGQNDLSASERQDLQTWMQLNNAATQARREGVEALRKAEQASKAGHTQEALDLLKIVSASQQFLSAADKQKVQQLTEQLRPGASSTAANGSGSLALARTKLQQARVMLTKGSYDAAMSLAVEADKLGAPYTAGEDTPKKVMEDINKSRAVVIPDGDAKSFLAAARVALDRADYDIAEHLAKEAEKKTSAWSSLRLWGDSPSKVLREVQAARARQAAKNVPPAKEGESASTLSALKAKLSVSKSSPVADDKSKTTVEGTKSTTEPAKPSPNAEAARQLVTQAREAQQKGDLAKAKALANQARALKADLSWWDDGPEKVLAEIAKVDGASKESKEAALNIPADPHAQLKMARELLAAGKLEDAEKVAQKANSAKGGTWGLFDDNPDKVLQEVRKLRAKRDQEESARVLAEARKLFDKANGDPTMLDEAERLAYKAERLHGSYSMLDMGDRPQKLRGEIDVARAKSRRSKLPLGPATAVVKNVSEPVKQASATEVAQAPPPDKPMPAPPVVTTSSVPTPILPALPLPANASDSQVTQVVSTTPSKPATRPQAEKLLTEARQMQKDGRLVEARQKALEAQKVGAPFGPEEDRPELALLAIGSLCEKRIEGLVQQATELSLSAGGDVAKTQKAEAALLQAKQLAEAFGFDAQPINTKLTTLKLGMSAAAPAPAPVAVVPSETKPTIADTGKDRGEALLSQARLELRRGETSTARRLAEEAFTGPYGVQPDAEKILRSIDVEEFNQKVLTAQRSFEAGVAAYQRKDYAQAGTILRTLDKQMLTPEKQIRLKELMMTPELQPRDVAQASHATPAPGRAQATDQPPAPPASSGLADQVAQMQQIKFQQLRQDGLRVMREATECFQAGETDKAMDMLRDYTARLREVQLEEADVKRLGRPVEMKLQQFATLKSQKDFERLQANQQEANGLSQQRAFLAEENKRKQVGELLKQSRAFFKDGKYKEAEMYAMRAKELDPDNTMTDAAIYTARIQGNQAETNKNKVRKEKMAVNALDDTDNPGPEVNSDHPLSVDTKLVKENRNRKATDVISFGSLRTEKERQIESRLTSPISFDFKDTPLSQVLEDMRDWTGINIVPDSPALNEDGVSLDRPITMKLEGVALKSALNLLLHQVHLTWVIKDDVLQITTESHAKGKLISKVHNVADLVLPIENASPGNNSLMRAAMGAGQGDNSNLRVNGSAPWLSNNGLQGGTTVSGSQANMTSTPATGGVTKEGPNHTMEDLLIKLITKTIAPGSWSDMGGPGTIEYYPLGMALVINQTTDIQEQIAELLAALRRLQDQEVSVEIRFITIAESFFERIGMDFNVNLKTDRFTTKYEPQIVSQQFKPFGFVNDFNPKSLIVGIQPGNTFTQDLDIPIRSTSFAQAIPPFGAFPNIPGGNGGIDLGLAFLSDIQVFLFMEAAQGDQRTNVMQAPKLTLFNGQTATITITDQQFFVTSVTVLQSGGQVVFVPNNNLIPTGGITLTMNAVISADRRFVRMSLAPTITNIASAVVQLFPITTFITPVFEGGAVGQPIPFTQFLQQPVFNTISVTTTVAVPDGGTVLMGGLKRLSEGRNEFGPPILSKIPYINRLFKNVGYGREAESLLMMVTPRIIINEEEELKQTGVDRNAPLGGQQ